MALLAVLVAAAPAQAERIAENLRLTASDGVPLHATTIGNRFNGGAAMRMSRCRAGATASCSAPRRTAS